MLVGSLNCHNESREFKMCFLPGLPGGQLYLVRLLETGVVRGELQLEA